MSDQKISTKNSHFDGLYYKHWNVLMESILCANGL